jgi:hypothetical protein
MPSGQDANGVVWCHSKKFDQVSHAEPSPIMKSKARDRREDHLTHPTAAPITKTGRIGTR